MSKSAWEGYIDRLIEQSMGLPRWHSGEDPPASAGDTRDMGMIPGSGRSPEGGNGSPL